MDLHRQKAAELFQVKPEEVTPAQREYAKMLSHVKMYSVTVPLSHVLPVCKK